MSILHFQSAHFEAMMTVNVTLLLVLTTLFIGISTALPRTSYVKMIDIWLIVNLLILFVDIILQTIINYIAEDVDKPKPKVLLRQVGISQSQTHDIAQQNFMHTNKKTMVTGVEKLAVLNFASQFILPGFYMVFCIIYFFIGLLVRWEIGQQI